MLNPAQLVVAARIQCGQIKKFVSNDRGGWYLIWSGDGRFRADADEFSTPPEIGSLVSFLPDARDESFSKSRLRRVSEVIFESVNEEK